MAKCEVCGNDYEGSFEINLAGKTHVFDSFECAINALAPLCAGCGVKVIGHGLQKDSNIYCCKSCAESHSVSGFIDHI